MAERSYYSMCKELGVCPECGNKAGNGNVYCPECAQKRREAVRRKAVRDKERAKTDPEFRERRRARKARNRIRYREKCKAEGRCYACGKPATHGVFCTKHWIANVKKSSDHPFRQIMKERPKLSVPQVSDRTRVDVGKIIALYNAGWTYPQIEREMKISHSTIGRYVKMAKEQMNDSKNL